MYDPNAQADYSPQDPRTRAMLALSNLRANNATVDTMGDFQVQPAPGHDYLALAAKALQNENSLRSQVAAQRAKNRQIAIGNIPVTKYQITGTGQHAGQSVGGPAFQAFRNAIIQQESGGNYGIVNHSSGALGAYQVLPSNLASWGMQTVGHPIRSPHHYLTHPHQQDAVAGAMLRRYFQKYGAAGAASAWYSGNPNAYKTGMGASGGPSVAEYVREVLKRMRRG